MHSIESNRMATNHCIAFCQALKLPGGGAGRMGAVENLAPAISAVVSKASLMNAWVVQYHSSSDSLIP
jgi:hypothetical protein